MLLVVAAVTVSRWGTCTCLWHACGLPAFPDLEAEGDHQFQAELLGAVREGSLQTPAQRSNLLPFKHKKLLFFLWAYRVREEVEERKRCFLHWLRTGSFIQHWNNEIHLPHRWPQLGHFMQFQQLRSSSRHKYLAKKGDFGLAKGRNCNFCK